MMRSALTGVSAASVTTRGANEPPVNHDGATVHDAELKDSA